MRALRLLSFVLVLAIWMGVLGISVGKEIRVPQDYKTIQEAIDAAAEGDIILVDRGTYKENLNLPKGLTLLGVDREKTVIDGSGSDVVTIASSSLVTMRNFTITNGRDGVYIRGGAHALLQGNWIIQNKRNGVLVTGTAELRGNLIRDNGYCGVQASSSAKVTGSGNIIQNNQSGDLCGNVPSEIKAEGGPPAPTVRVNPSDWTNKNNFTLDWENPDYPAAIVAAWYKVGSAPTASEDGRRTTEKPVSLQSPAEGRTPVWLWLEDELKQKDHKNAGQAFLLWDPTPPTIIVTLDPRPNSNGWNNADVTVRFTCNDALSGVASCTPTEPVRFTQEGKGQTVKAEAIDRAGNRAEQTVTVNIDKTKPQITVGSPQGTLGNEGWFRSDVSVTFSATDNLAGFANGQLRYEETKRTSGEGPELRITFSVSDLAGNAAQEQAGPFKVDKTPPTISYEISPQPNSYGWNNTDVTVTFRCSDGLSGIVSCTPSDPVRFTQEGRGQTVKAEAIDQAGNRAERVVTINLDKTKPAVSCQPPDASRWYREDVSVPCTASDATSGLANPADASFTLVARGEGTSVSTGTRRVEDQAGNSATAGPYTFQIDKTPPTISYEISPQPNSYGWNNTDVTVSFRCDDRLSGVARCNDPIRVTQEGRRSIEGTGEDRAGNVGRVTVQVNIDKTPPTGSLTINDGAASTTSTI
ncbi:MAG: right-handed parallel beta-helix repeat-containing protein, partial [Candidatus Caldarchaeum sp.]